MDKDRKTLNALDNNIFATYRFSGIGSWRYVVSEGRFYGSEEMFRIYDIDPMEFKNSFAETIRLIHPDDRNMIIDAMDKHLLGESTVIELRIPQKDGSLRYIVARGEPIVDEGGQVIEVLGTVHDITENKKLAIQLRASQEEMAYIANHDILTGLPNYTSFVNELRNQCQHARENKKSFALMMLDIDGLKDIKYYLGYEIRNQLVVGVVKRLRAYLGEDIFISRYSDDHFAIIIQGLRDLGDYETIGNGILSQFNKSFKLQNYQLDLKANLGVCIWPKDADDFVEIRRNSNLALMRAIKEGKNLLKFYSPDVDIKNYKEFVFKSDLYEAIGKNQFSIQYQPMVNLKTNQILGGEAFIRWNHPQWGVVRAKDFIYLAEETGLIIDIGKWVLREICKSYKEWMDKGLPAIKMAVNFSPVQFYEENFVDNIVGIIEEYGLSPSFLIIEISESFLLKNRDKLANDIKELKSYGIQIAIDDFGTGYSSLTYLASFNVDLLEIDKDFINKIPKDEDTKTIIKFIVGLAKELKVKLVAEGIENFDQLEFLKSQNCHTGQGYIFSEPVGAKDFEKILAKGNLRPVLIGNLPNAHFEERRKFFRVRFTQLLEGDLTILEIQGRKINVGNTKILIKNIGPGGLSFISNIKFPVGKDIILQFTTNLLGREISVYGYPVWTEEADNDLHQYGVEFTVDENERMDLVRDLNQVQIKLRKNELFVEGSFISGTYTQYFSNL